LKSEITMPTVPATGASSHSSPQAPNANATLRGLDMDHFLTLMITELQNQDPLNPMDNAQILEQISQIREIGATSDLQETLEAVLLGQNLSNASSLLNKRIAALTDAGEQVQGVVERVSVAENKVQLTVAGRQVALGNVSEILPE
jgi:flagellar basal-body rod modification protein FlgD